MAGFLPQISLLRPQRGAIKTQQSAEDPKISEISIGVIPRDRAMGGSVEKTKD
jgi:hypothetical protein